uniref:Plasminogen-like n=1 Tax=Crassostrea virginica TaxID=6565 RepID=A0A8B8AIK1_CRAVI|nr:plasminogen-like [Crassostrea virginica]XP_022291357.1 plasminogen-like [Crassostrea virginica]
MRTVVLSLFCSLHVLSGTANSPGCTSNNPYNILLNYYCKTSESGGDYIGTISRTISGRTCQSWEVQYPHKHHFEDELPGSAAAHRNYCRNPSNKMSGGPWCFTTDPSVEWEYCNVPMCQYDCLYTKKGREYIGSMSKTKSGRTCQRWDSQTPHVIPAALTSRFSGPFSCHENFCRNTANASRPWCYTTDPEVKMEFCDIDFCNKK